MTRLNIADLQPQEIELTAKELTNVRGGLKLLSGVTLSLGSTDVALSGRAYTESGR